MVSIRKKKVKKTRTGAVARLKASAVVSQPSDRPVLKRSAEIDLTKGQPTRESLHYLLYYCNF